MQLFEKKTVTCKEMKKIESAADRNGLSYYEMMENAGSGAAKISLESFRKERGFLPKTAVIFVGKGNNGGDGLVMARIFAIMNISVTVILVDGSPVTADSITNFNLLPESVKITDLQSFKAEGSLEETIAVDAVYGTGFHGRFRENGLVFSDMINELKKSGAFVVAVDIPSGLSGDMKEEDDIENEAVAADLTVTFHAKKPVHGTEKAGRFLGRTEVVDIGIAEALKRQ